MIGNVETVGALAREHPEWSAWLTVVEIALAELANPSPSSPGSRVIPCCTRAAGATRKRSIVPGRTAIAPCNACRGYVKVLPRLRGAPPQAVLLHDLATVELDIAAAGKGYVRPQHGGYALEVALSVRDV